MDSVPVSDGETPFGKQCFSIQLPDGASETQDLDQETPSHVTEMSRFYIRALWGGVRLSVRIDAFATAGFGYLMEDFEGVTAGGNTFSAAGARAVMGTKSDCATR